MNLSSLDNVQPEPVLNSEQKPIVIPSAQVSANALVVRCLSIRQKSKKNTKHIGNGLRRNVYKRDNNKCLRCGSREDLSIDHIVPVIKGGVKAKFNLQTLCVPCNCWKGDRIIDFRQ